MRSFHFPFMVRFLSSIAHCRSFRRFPVPVSLGGLPVAECPLAIKAAIDFPLGRTVVKRFSTVGAYFRSALWDFHVLPIAFNRWVVSVHCHVLSVARPGLLGGYGAQGEIVRFLAHGSHSFISRHSSMMSLTINRITHTSIVAISTQKIRNTITKNTALITSAILCASFQPVQISGQV